MFGIILNWSFILSSIHHSKQEWDRPFLPVRFSIKEEKRNEKKKEEEDYSNPKVPRKHANGLTIYVDPKAQVSPQMWEENSILLLFVLGTVEGTMDVAGVLLLRLRRI